MTTFDRRRFLASSVAAGAATGALVAVGGAGPADAAGPAYFGHGVASGDPLPTGVVLWTRVTPVKGAAAGSGKGPDVSVVWQVAHDAGFRRLAAHGTARTGSYRDHTVKVDARGLAPATDYYYRFLLHGVASPTGRTRTAPRKDADLERLRFGVVSCANLQAGWFSVYRHLADRDDLDFVLHLGDYLYEYGPGEYGYGNSNIDIRSHVPAHEMLSLADYRQRHGQYKTDHDLQRLHATYAFIATWDDHEVTDNRWKDGAANHDAGEGDYLARQRAAYQAYDEWMPIRLSGTAKVGDGTRLFRRLSFGRLAELSMLDLRTYRDEQAATGSSDVSSPDRTLTGRRQMDWLKESMTQERATWKLVGNPVMIAPVVVPPLPNDLTGAVNDVAGLLPADGAPYNTDQWDGYTADRHELFAHLSDNGVQNAVFLTGDIHSTWAADLPADPGTYAATGATVGTELVFPSVTSNNLKDITGTPARTTSIAVENGILAANRHLKYLDFDDHGFGIVDVTADRLQMDVFAISDRADKSATLRHLTSWATVAGSQMVSSAASPVVSSVGQRPLRA